ncbi:MAG: CotH kinase family protein [Bacteroidota bacterium]
MKLKPFFFGMMLILFSTQSSFAQDFYDINTIQEIRIEFKDPDWRYTLDSLKISTDGERVKADVIINGIRYNDAGVRYRGSSSYVYAGSKNPFNIKLNHTDKSQIHDGVTTLKLSNNSSDPTYVREVLAYSIARKYVPAPKANFAAVYINGKFEGLYTNIESVGSKFLKKRYGSSDNAFYKCTPYIDGSDPSGCLKGVFAALVYQGDGPKCYTGIYEDKNESGYEALISLVKALKDNPSELEAILDVNETLWMHAFNNALVNLSSYSGKFSHNYYIYQDDEGRFHPILWDLNLSFGTFKNTGIGFSLNLDQLHTMDPLLHKGNSEKPLISALLQNKRYEKIYLAHLRTILRENFRNQEYLETANKLRDLIAPYIRKDWNTYFEYWQFEESFDQTINEGTEDIPGLAAFMTQRTNFLRKHPSLLYLYPTVELLKDEITINADNSATIKTRVKNRPTSLIIYYRNKGDLKYKSVAAFDDGKHEDGKKKDGVWAAKIPLKQGQTVEYYFMAENKGAIRFEPQNYYVAPLNLIVKE